MNTLLVCSYPVHTLELIVTVGTKLVSIIIYITQFTDASVELFSYLIMCSVLIMVLTANTNRITVYHCMTKLIRLTHNVSQ